MRKKVCVVITARPSYSRIKTAMVALRARHDVELQIVVCGSALLERYGNVAAVIERDLFQISERIYMVMEGDNPQLMAQTTGLGMVQLAAAFDRLKPDVVVSIADRYETLATAAAAAYMNIRLCHVQGGEVTGSIDDKVRNAVTQLADVHCVATEAAANTVRRATHKGDNVLRVHQTGCPSIDLAAHATLKWGDISMQTLVLNTGTGDSVNISTPYAVVLQHPVTDEAEDAFSQAMNTAIALEESKLQTLWFWPNVDAGSDGTSKALRRFKETRPGIPVRFIRNLDPEDFIRLADRAAVVVGNSSFGIREAAFLGIPVVNIGSRQRGRERAGNVLDVPLHKASDIKAAIAAQMGALYDGDTLYGDGHAGDRIATILAGDHHGR